MSVVAAPRNGALVTKQTILLIALAVVVTLRLALLVFQQ